MNGILEVKRLILNVFDCIVLKARSSRHDGETSCYRCNMSQCLHNNLRELLHEKNEIILLCLLMKFESCEFRTG